MFTCEAEPASLSPKIPESEKLEEKAWTSLINTFLSRIFLRVYADLPSSIFIIFYTSKYLGSN